MGNLILLGRKTSTSSFSLGSLRSTHSPNMSEEKKEVDYSLNNPDTLTKYRTAATISEKVLAEVSKLCVPGAKFVEVCQKGDKILEEEIDKVYRGKKAIKIQLGAQIDGFGTIVCDTIFAGKSGEISGREADLALATHYSNELLLRLMVPPGLLSQGTDEEKAKAAKQKAPSQSQITSLLETVCKSYECNLVESTTSWLFDHNEIEGAKKIVLAPAEGTRGDGVPEVSEVWGVEMGVSLGSGKVKNRDERATLHRKTLQTYGLKRPTSRKVLSEVSKKFGNFPFSLRQLEDERDAKLGAVECVRGNIFRQYEVVGDKEDAPVARLLTTVAITKNGLQKLGGPPALDVSKYKTDKKITDEEVLKILEQPLSRNVGKKNKKKKPKKKTAKKDGEEEEDSDDE